MVSTNEIVLAIDELNKEVARRRSDVEKARRALLEDIMVAYILGKVAQIVLNHQAMLKKLLQNTATIQKYETVKDMAVWLATVHEDRGIIVSRNELTYRHDGLGYIVGTKRSSANRSNQALYDDWKNSFSEITRRVQENELLQGLPPIELIMSGMNYDFNMSIRFVLGD